MKSKISENLNLKKLGLRPAFFLLPLGCLLLSLSLAVAVWQICNDISAGYPHTGVEISSDGVVVSWEEPTAEQSRILAVLSGIRLGSLFLLPVCGLAAAAGMFYHFKLKPPIMALRLGTRRIQSHDLDFEIPAVSEDELGEICAAFETMRAELLKTNQELWRQGEERKRLNAAFSHDLRNPITVLKGTVRLLRQGRADEQALERMESYVLRIEQYVEAMSSIQRLSQMPVRKKDVSLARLASELEETARLLAPALKLSLKVEGAEKPGRHWQAAHGDIAPDQTCGEGEAAWIDHGIFLTVAENLIGNAARFSRDELFLTLTKRDDFLLLTVGDNGGGYPARLLEMGPEPFRRRQMEEERPSDLHFGMGLYGCKILCEKHGGTLRLENISGKGAAATAVLAIEFDGES